MQSQCIKIINGKIITPSGLRSGIVYLKNGKIDSITGSNESMDDAITIDAEQNYVSPGFIDIHLHGGGGYDFMDNNLDEYFQIAALHAAHGATALNPTTLSCENQDLLKTIETYDKAAASPPEGAAFIGLHIEGPYFAINQRGAQDPRFIRNPDPGEYMEILNSGRNITRWSAAPELPGALDFGRILQSKNILPAIAHTDAVYEEVLKAVDAGYRHVTHLYSAMSGITRKNALRYAGVVESSFLLDKLTVELIADGIHAPAPLLQLAYKIKGADNIALITDAMRAAGTNTTESLLGSRKDGIPVVIEGGVAKLSDRSAFAGSIATCDLLVRNMIDLAGVSVFDAVKMMTATPAKIMGVHSKKGDIVKGKDADIVIFDNQINIVTTIVNGRIVYNATRQHAKQAAQ